MIVKVTQVCRCVRERKDCVPGDMGRLRMLMMSGHDF